MKKRAVGRWMRVYGKASKQSGMDMDKSAGSHTTLPKE
jgi:hypothetical protein